MKKLNFNDLKKTNNKNYFLTVQFLLQSSKSPHFPLRGKVGQLSERRRVLCWSIYSILLVYDLTQWRLVTLSDWRAVLLRSADLPEPPAPYSTKG